MAKIAFLSFYSGIVERGVENFVFEIAKRLKKKNQITIFQAGPVANQFGVRTVPIKAFGSAPKQTKSLLAKIYFDFQSLKILLFSILATPKIIKGKFDVVIPLNGGWQSAIYRMITKLTGAKLLVSGHAGIGADDCVNLFFRPDAFIALTSTQNTWAKRLAPEVKIVTIPNGVDLAKFNPHVQAKKLSLPKPIVVCSSALVPYKRIDLTIKAVAKAKLSLLLLGDGQLRGQIDALGKRLLGQKYLRLCPPYSQMPPYYRAGSIFSLASITEAFGIAYIEAMACNLPVVATADESRAEIIGNAGILTDPTKIDQYAKDLKIAVTTNYNNTPYDQALKFSWNKTAKDYSLLIKQLIGKK